MCIRDRLEVGHLLLLGLQGKVRLAALLAGFGQLLLPQGLRLLVLPAPLGTQAAVPVFGGVEQRGGEGHDSLARTGWGHDGQVEVGRILHPLVEEAHAGQQRAAAVERTQQQEIALVGIGRGADTPLQQRRQGVIHFPGDEGQGSHEGFIFFRHFVRLVGRFRRKTGFKGTLKLALALFACLFRRHSRTNILITRQHPLADVAGVEVGHGVAGGIERDDLVQFLRRKTFTAGRAAQAQGDVVALSGTEGILLLEAVDESRQEAFARHDAGILSACGGRSGAHRLRGGRT